MTTSSNTTHDSPRIILPGGAGLVGYNLALRLYEHGHRNLVVLDKHAANVAVLRELLPDIEVLETDLATKGDWDGAFAGADAVVMLQAQIGALDPEPFQRNNIVATDNVLAAMRAHQVPYLVHVSSSVVESVADDLYTQTKAEQERIIEASRFDHVTLRPTLMFGWFDRKHLGWLARFMQRMPIFPIPGHGRYPRQPLYVGDFCRIIEQCLEWRFIGGPYNISGLQHVNYIDIIRAIKQSTAARTWIVNIPYGLFRALLRTWAMFDSNPPFTVEQLEALVAGDEFEVIDWPGIFGVSPTGFDDAIHETFAHPRYSRIELQF